MFKTPTSHGLDRKFKSWRKGKSQKANKKGSLKQQLRGHERLLAKLSEDQTDRSVELQRKIRDLKAEIGEKQQNLQEKKNAERAHGPRFLDRQKLTRKEKQERNGKNRKLELQKLALDEVYVAHHPNDIKYMPLYQKGQRVVDQSRQLYRRAITRKRILKMLASPSSPSKLCTWIAKEQYDQLPKDWTIQDEETTFGGSISRRDMKGKKVLQTEDSRFALASQHDAVVQAADELETKMDEVDGDAANEHVKDSEESDSDSSMDNNDQPKTLAKAAELVKVVAASSSGSSSDSDSSDDSDSSGTGKKLQASSSPKGDEGDVVSSSDDTDSSSSSDSSDSDSEEDDKKIDKPSLQAQSAPKPEEEDEVDDFLLDNDDDQNDIAEVFQNASAQLPALAHRGDKSRGWETQRQRPGEFKRRRVRR